MQWRPKLRFSKCFWVLLVKSLCSLYIRRVLSGVKLWPDNKQQLNYSSYFHLLCCYLNTDNIDLAPQIHSLFTLFEFPYLYFAWLFVYTPSPPCFPFYNYSASFKNMCVKLTSSVRVINIRGLSSVLNCLVRTGLVKSQFSYIYSDFS